MRDELDDIDEEEECDEEEEECDEDYDEECDDDYEEDDEEERKNKCIICNKLCTTSIKDQDGNDHEDVIDAVDFESIGNWASSFWDSEDSYISLLICDNCLKERKSHITVIKRVKTIT